MPLALKIILIIAGVLLALLAVFCTIVIAMLTIRIKLKISYRDSLFWGLYIGGIQVFSVPKPPKKLRKLRTYTKEKAIRAAQKQARHAEDYLEMVRQHALYRALMQKRAQEKAKKKKAPVPNAKPKAKAPQEQLEIEVLMQMISELIEAFFQGTRRGLRVHVCKLHLDIVGKDAAETALLCGAAWAGISNLLAIIDAHTKLRVHKTNVRIQPDYTGEKTSTDFSLVISFSTFRAMQTFFTLIPVILTHKDNLYAVPKTESI